MKDLIIVIVCIVLVVFFISRARNLKNQSESKSKLSIFEHPSTFEKPPIEIVSSNPKKKSSKIDNHP